MAEHKTWWSIQSLSGPFLRLLFHQAGCYSIRSQINQVGIKFGFWLQFLRFVWLDTWGFGKSPFKDVSHTYFQSVVTTPLQLILDKYWFPSTLLHTKGMAVSFIWVSFCVALWGVYEVVRVYEGCITDLIYGRATPRLSLVQASGQGQRKTTCILRSQSQCTLVYIFIFDTGRIDLADGHLGIIRRSRFARWCQLLATSKWVNLFGLEKILHLFLFWRRSHKSKQ